jgi:hypothetical protein
VSDGGVFVSACLGDGNGDGGDDACSGCYLAAEPQAETLVGLDHPFVNQKVRYLSFFTTDVGQLQAIRVALLGLPEPYESWNGTVMWVQPPQRYCERGGQIRPPSCPDPEEPSLPWEYWGSTLGCDPYFADWAAFGVVHVFHEGVVPDAGYLVQALDLSCHLAGIPGYSEALIMETSPWGDTVADCTTTPCGAPNDIASIVDVTAVLDKFMNLPGCVQKVRADLEGAPAGDHRVPDQLVSITDVVYCLGAFLGDTYPPAGFPEPSPPPCQP